MTAQEVLDTPGELYLNSPLGYPYAEKIERNDIMQLKRFLISTTPDEDVQEMVRQMSLPELIQSYLNNNFTFDAEWLGVRLLEERDMSTWRRSNY